MKKPLSLRLVLFFWSLALPGILLAQIPNAISYQAVARNVSGVVIDNTSMTVRASLFQGSPSGTLMYVEKFSITTNQYGLFKIELGRGTALGGDFSTITWGTDSYWLRIDLDPLNTGTYTTMGTTEMLTVPYAFYAATSGGGASSSLTSTSSTSNNNDPNAIGACSISGSFAAVAPLTINDVASQTTTFTSAGLSGTICKVIVTMTIVHPNAGDLDISLTSPGGTTIVLTSDNGEGGANYSGVIFSDNADGLVLSGDAPFTGLYVPEQPLSKFAGETPNGVWTLTVVDDAAVNTGTLVSASITVFTNAPATYTYIGETSVTLAAGEEAQFMAHYSARSLNNNPVFLKVSRDATTGSGSTGTDVAYTAFTPTKPGDFVDLYVMDRETGLAAGTYFYKVWVVSSPLVGSENTGIIVNQH